MSTIENKTYSRTAEYRKICKPIVERKRRARMNKSLIELKSIILDVVKKDGCQYSKLEKADILEMTVKHLHQLRKSPHHQASTVMQKPEESIDKFRAGFVQCAAEVSRFMCQVDSVTENSATRVRLLHHLNSCVGQLDQLTTVSQPQSPTSLQQQQLSPSVRGQYPVGVSPAQGHPIRVYTPPNSPKSPVASSFTIPSSPISQLPVSLDPIKKEIVSPLALTVPTRHVISNSSNASPWRPW